MTAGEHQGVHERHWCDPNNHGRLPTCIYNNYTILYYTILYYRIQYYTTLELYDDYRPAGQPTCIAREVEREVHLVQVGEYLVGDAPDCTLCDLRRDHVVKKKVENAGC